MLLERPGQGGTAATRRAPTCPAASHECVQHVCSVVVCLGLLDANEPLQVSLLESATAHASRSLYLLPPGSYHHLSYHHSNQLKEHRLEIPPSKRQPQKKTKTNSPQRGKVQPPRKMVKKKTNSPRITDQSMQRQPVALVPPLKLGVASVGIRQCYATGRVLRAIYPHDVSILP